MYDHLDSREQSEPQTPMVGDDVDTTSDEATPMLGTDPPAIPDDAETPMVGGETEPRQQDGRDETVDVAKTE